LRVVEGAIRFRHFSDSKRKQSEICGNEETETETEEEEEEFGGLPGGW